MGVETAACHRPGLRPASRYEEIHKYLWKDSTYQPDNIGKSIFRSWDELYGPERAEVEEGQLKAAQERFETLRPKVRELGELAAAKKVGEIRSLNDLIPLLFQHTHYKAYPVSLLEKGRFDLLTRWLSGLTSVDLSGVDATSCDTIDGWLDLLEQKAPLAMFHTSGTTGKLSFYPRARMERDLYLLVTYKKYESFAGSPGINLGFDGVRMPSIHPSQRYGHYSSQNAIKFNLQYLTPTPEQCYTLNNGNLSADLASLSGRIRMAQAKGELAKMKLSDAMRVKFKQYLAELERRPEETSQFMQKLMTVLRGQRVYLSCQTSYLVKAAEEGLKHGVSRVFAPDSIGSIGGGRKGVTLPDNWRALISEFTGMTEFAYGYGMTEMIGSMSNCSAGVFHLLPFHIPFLLDPVTGAPLPREGTQTGRFAFLDLLAQTYWGGLVSADKMTIEWDSQCACGRRGAFLHDDVTRYSEQVTGDDKVMCSATVDNTDAALRALLDV